MKSRESIRLFRRFVPSPTIKECRGSVKLKYGSSFHVGISFRSCLFRPSIFWSNGPFLVLRPTNNAYHCRFIVDIRANGAYRLEHNRTSRSIYQDQGGNVTVKCLNFYSFEGWNRGFKCYVIVIQLQSKRGLCSVQAGDCLRTFNVAKNRNYLCNVYKE